jgi:hypothetical protein
MLRSLASTAARLHVRDDRETPLCTRRDDEMKPLIWGEHKTEYFSREIWTGVIDLKARLKLVFRRKRFGAESACEGGKRDGDRTHSRPTGKSRHIASVGA